MPSAGVYVLDVAALALVQRAVTFIGEQIGKAKDCVERRAKLVAHGREELILEPARAFGFFFRVQDRFLRPLATGDITENHNTSLQNAVPISERSGGSTHPNALRRS